MGADIPEKSNPGEYKPAPIVINHRLEEIRSPLENGEHGKKMGLVHLAAGIGFDANKMEWVDMIKSGIIDPAKVTRSALQNAASIASLLLTTECVVTDIP